MIRDTVDRRTMIKAAAVAGAGAWTAPVIIDSLASPAAAETPVVCAAGTRAQVFTGTASSATNGSITFTVPNAIPVGHSVVVAIAMSTAGTPGVSTYTATDNAAVPNTYTTHVVFENGAIGTVYIASAQVTSPISAGGTITASYPSSSTQSSGAVFDFCGLLTAGDTNAAGGNSSTPSSGTVAAVAGDLVLGGFQYGNNGVAYSGASPGLANVEGETTTGRRFQPMWSLISSAGNYAASGTLPSGNFWTAAVVQFTVA